MKKEELIARFEAPAPRRKLRENYTALLRRIHCDGFFPESLTGTYSGMFPRTVGALAQLLTRTGEYDLLEKSITCCMNAMQQHRLEHVPHVIDKTAENQLTIFDPLCQIDGQAHLLLAWALLNTVRGETDYENKTYDFFARLMDRSVSEVFLGHCTEWRCEPGVILNTHLEHSREWNMWIAYDFLSNSFMTAALEKMTAVARRRNDREKAERWQRILQHLLANINRNMIFEYDGKTCYREMLLPTGRAPIGFPGLSWLNLAPIPAGCGGLFGPILDNTIALWHEKATIRWDGPAITACEWNFQPGNDPVWNGPAELSCEWSPEGHNNQTYGKMLGWDLLYCVSTGNYQRAGDALDFLELVNPGELYSEIFTYKPSRRQWVLRDAGNGEQSAWLCWALIESRIRLGLKPW